MGGAGSAGGLHTLKSFKASRCPNQPPPETPCGHLPPAWPGLPLPGSDASRPHADPRSSRRSSPFSMGPASRASLHRPARKDPFHSAVHSEVQHTSRLTGLSQRPLLPPNPAPVLVSAPPRRAPQPGPIPTLLCSRAHVQFMSKSAFCPLRARPQHSRPGTSESVLSTEPGPLVQAGPRTPGSATRQKNKGKKRCKDCEEETKTYQRESVIIRTKR